MEKSAAARHSADYRARQNEIKAKMGIETLKIEAPAGTRSGMETSMKEHGYSQVQELWQDLALSFLAMPHEEQVRRLRKPDAKAFVITPKLARQLRKKGMAEADPDYDA
ncbi:hypothetical protein NPS29_16745 [Pseudomonas putida]|uniref:hypothetical protein n=1 Tax=Pseudomonas putida TaxID=303 RepID=UPI002364386F|nr:hypothetical protein [Pseudomonas putida]MDD1966979.1 hypothetical protein [Pseudomonas putida]